MCGSDGLGDLGRRVLRGGLVGGGWGMGLASRLKRCGFGVITTVVLW